jgi:Flp pilus assembly protein TadB
VPLSEHEQRAFEQIERSLAEDPKFASAVRSHDPRVRGRRRLVLAVLIVLAGLGLVVFGTVNNLLLLGAGGFVVMLAGAAFAMQSQRRAKNPTLQAVDGTSSRSTRRKSSFIDRLEERWRRRPEGNR